MKQFLIYSLLLLLNVYHVIAQEKTIDVVGMHQLIDESKAENSQQVKARNQQAAATANEQGNLTMIEKLQVKYRELQKRYNTLGTLITIADIGVEATPMIDRIISNQSQIVALTQKNPALIVLGIQTEIEFVEKAKSLFGYVAGLALSIGDVNQMKASDRKLLFDYIITQLSSIQDLSGTMLINLQYSTLSSLLRAANPFQNFIDADKAISSDILQKAKYLK